MRRPAASAARVMERRSAWLKYDGTVMTASLIVCSAIQQQTSPARSSSTLRRILQMSTDCISEQGKGKEKM